MDEKIDQNTVMDETIIQDVGTDEKSGKILEKGTGRSRWMKNWLRTTRWMKNKKKNSVMYANIDPKVVMALSMFEIGG